MLFRFGKTRVLAGIQDGKDSPKTREFLKTMKSTLGLGRYPFNLKKGRVQGKSYVGVKEDWKDEVKALYNDIYFYVTGIFIFMSRE
jgi:hypothetical protein